MLAQLFAVYEQSEHCIEDEIFDSANDFVFNNNLKVLAVVQVAVLERLNVFCYPVKFHIRLVLQALNETLISFFSFANVVLQSSLLDNLIQTVCVLRILLVDAFQLLAKIGKCFFCLRIEVVGDLLFLVGVVGYQLRIELFVFCRESLLCLLQKLLCLCTGFFCHLQSVLFFDVFEHGGVQIKQRREVLDFSGFEVVNTCELL